VASIKRALSGRLPLIGFAGSPFTLACYMIEGRAGSEFATVRAMAYARPDLLDQVTDVNARAVAPYLRAQIDAGADVVMLFDTWGGLLPAWAWRRFSLEPMRAVLRALPPGVPTIVFTKGGGAWLDDLAQSGASCVGVDWMVDLQAARAEVGDRVAVQGNLDPLVLTTDQTTVEREARRVLDAAGSRPGHVFNVGHGLIPTTKPELVEVLVETVKRSAPVRAAAV
jgi:uroporphyrinogen decarboxylase